MKEIVDIWIIGDSHVSAFAQDAVMIAEFPFVAESLFSGVKVCRLGPQLAGTLNKSRSSSSGRTKAFELADQIFPGSTVFFSFGEIDCRAHIVWRAGYKTELIEQSVEDTIKNYMKFVTDFRAALAAKDVQIGVLSPPPTAKSLNPIHDYFAIEFLASISRPKLGRNLLRIARNFFFKRSRIRQAIGLTLNYSGTDNQIIAASQSFHEKLSEKSVANDLLFIDMRSRFVTDAGRPDPKWFWDPIHLRQSAVLAISKEFEDLGIRNFNGL